MNRQEVHVDNSVIRRRVVYTLRTFPEPSETFIDREIEGLRRHGVAVTVLAAWRASGTVPEGLDVRWVTGPDAPTPLRWPSPAVWADLRRFRADPRRWARALRLAWLASRARDLLPADAWVLHAHFANDAAALARYLSCLSGVPFRVTAHAYDLFQDPFLLGPNLSAAAHVYTVSDANLSFLKSRAVPESWDLDRFSVLRCGIDLDEFAYRDPGPPRTPARLFCAARLVPKKGHAVLLETVKRLAADGHDVRLALAGDGPLMPALRRQVDEGGIASRVDFLGSVPVAEVRRRMADSDLVVLASRIAEDGDRDGLPVVLIEALALGVPAVSTRVAGIPELLTDDVGRTVDPDRADLLAAAIREALDEEPGARVTRSRRGRSRVEASFDLRRQVAELSPPTTVRGARS